MSSQVACLHAGNINNQAVTLLCVYPQPPIHALNIITAIWEHLSSLCSTMASSLSQTAGIYRSLQGWCQLSRLHAPEVHQACFKSVTSTGQKNTATPGVNLDSRTASFVKLNKLRAALVTAHWESCALSIHARNEFVWVCLGVCVCVCVRVPDATLLCLQRLHLCCVLSVLSYTHHVRFSTMLCC